MQGLPEVDMFHNETSMREAPASLQARLREATPNQRTTTRQPGNSFAVSPCVPLRVTSMKDNLFIWGDVCAAPLSLNSKQGGPVTASGSSCDPSGSCTEPGCNSRQLTGFKESRRAKNLRDSNGAYHDSAADRWAAISLGNNHVAGISVCGKLFSWRLKETASMATTDDASVLKSRRGAGQRSDGMDAGSSSQRSFSGMPFHQLCPAFLIQACPPQLVRVPVGVQVRTVTCGGDHTLAITTSGVMAWGCNRMGQCGLGLPFDLDLVSTSFGSPAPSSVPEPRVVPGLRGVTVCQLAAGQTHSLALTAGSQVLAWGDGGEGQLGLGDRRSRGSPVAVPGLWALPVAQIAAGDYHSAAVTTGGHAFLWGANHYGQLGLPTEGLSGPEPGTSQQHRSPQHPQDFLRPPHRWPNEVGAGSGPPHALESNGAGGFQAQPPEVSAEARAAVGSSTGAQVRDNMDLQPSASGRRQLQRTCPGSPAPARESSRAAATPARPHLPQLLPRLAAARSPLAPGTPRTPGSARRAVMRRHGQANPQWLLAMVEMGIPPRHARIALEESGNAGVEVATEWLFTADRSAILEEPSDSDDTCNDRSKAAAPAGGSVDGAGAGTAAGGGAAGPSNSPGLPAQPRAYGDNHCNSRSSVRADQGATHTQACSNPGGNRRQRWSGVDHRAEAAFMAAEGGSASWSSSAAAAESDWGWSSLVLEPRRLPLKAVRNLAAGARHTVAVTDAGVFAWGCGSDGALGLGDLDGREVPCRLDSFAALGRANADPTAAPRTGSGDASPSRPPQPLLARSRLGSADSNGGCLSGPSSTAHGQAVRAKSSGGGRTGSGVYGSAQTSCPSSPAAFAPVVIHRVACGACHTLFLAQDGSMFWCGTMTHSKGASSGSGTGPQVSSEGRHVDRQMQEQASADGAPAVLRIEADCGGPRRFTSTVPQLMDWIDPAAGLWPSAGAGAASDAGHTDDTACGAEEGSAAAQYGSGMSRAGRAASTRAPVVFDVVARGANSAVLLCSADELPHQPLGSSRPRLLEKLRGAITVASRARAAGSDVGALSASLKAVTAGVKMVLSSPAAISAVFGRAGGSMGLDAQLLEEVLTSIRKIFTPPRPAAVGLRQLGPGSDVVATVSELHRYSMISALQEALGALVDDLASHVRLLGTPERAQVLLAALQHPLLTEPAVARHILPKLVATALAAPPVVRTWLVRWWAEYPGPLLESRVVAPLQAHLTRELGATKKLTTALMNIIRLLAHVEEAAGLSRSLPPEAFYNSLISEKLDVQDHYSAWRQAQELTACRAAPLSARDTPFSFCSYPFLLNPRAKSQLMHLEARFQMEQSVAHARMEVQLYGGSMAARRRAEEGLVLAKAASATDGPAAPARTSRNHATSDNGGGPSTRRGPRGSSSGAVNGASSSGGGGGEVAAPLRTRSTFLWPRAATAASSIAAAAGHVAVTGSRVNGAPDGAGSSSTGRSGSGTQSTNGGSWWAPSIALSRRSGATSGSTTHRGSRAGSRAWWWFTNTGSAAVNTTAAAASSSSGSFTSGTSGASASASGATDASCATSGSTGTAASRSTCSNATATSRSSPAAGLGYAAGASVAGEAPCDAEGSSAGCGDGTACSSSSCNNFASSSLASSSSLQQLAAPSTRDAVGDDIAARTAGGGGGGADRAGCNASATAAPGGSAAGASLGSSFRGMVSLLRRRRRVSPAADGSGRGGGGAGPRAALHRGEVAAPSFELPRPSECSVPGIHSDMCIVRVRRSHLVEDALEEVGRQARRDLYKPLRVHFIGEEGIDAGGVKKEFFALLMERLLSPDYGMMTYDDSNRTYWFNAASLEPPESYFLLGLLLGLAVYNRVLLDFPAPLLLYQKLRGGRELGLRDLEGWRPELARGLRQVLEYDGPEPLADVFGLTFSVDVDRFGTVETVPLKPGGEHIWVMEDNRAEYVSLLAAWHMSGSVEPQFSAFSSGFRVLCDGPALSLFNAQELERLVCGSPRLDFAALRDAARYDGGYSRDTAIVRWLWDIVLNELAPEDQRAFLKFFTGSDRSPLGGLGSLHPVVQRDGPDSHKLPTAHTCFNTLLLPEYDSRAKLGALLRLAINNSEGFGLQ